MKKMILSLLALGSMAPVMGQDAADQITEEIAMQPEAALVQEKAPGKMREMASRGFQRLKAMPGQVVASAKNMHAFERTVNYLKGARDCFRGIGCSKIKSYFANYLLGAATGFASSYTRRAVATPGSPFALMFAALQGIIIALGYEKLAPTNTDIAQCLKFKGCDEGTRRYAFFVLGVLSGENAAPFAYRTFKKAWQSAREGVVSVPTEISIYP